MSAGYKILYFFHPFTMQGIHASGYFFIRAHPVNAAHKQISEYGRITCADTHLRIDLEAGIGFNSAKIQGNDGNLRHAGFFQCPDKSDIVGRPASASCLGNDNGRFV